MRMNRKWAALGMFAAAQLAGKCKKNAFEAVQIYGATAYLKGVRIVRDFFLYQMGILACVLFVVFGAICMEGAVIFYLPVQASTKLLLVFILGVGHFLTGGLILCWLASSKLWLQQASKYNAWVAASMQKNLKKGDPSCALF